MAHLPKCKIKVILHNIKGESWTVNSVPTTRVHTSHTLCGGWMAFVRGNDIKVDDICIFELVRKCELRVNILGEGREWLKGLREKVDSDGLPNGCSATSHRTVEGSPKKIKEKCSKIPLEHSVKMNSSGKKMSKTRKEAGFSKHIKKCGGESKSVGKYAACSQSKACYEKIGKFLLFFSLCFKQFMLPMKGKLFNVTKDNGTFFFPFSFIECLRILTMGFIG